MTTRRTRNFLKRIQKSHIGGVAGESGFEPPDSVSAKQSCYVALALPTLLKAGFRSALRTPARNQHT